MVVALGNRTDHNLRLDGIPVLVAHCPVDRPDHLATVHRYLAQKAGLRFEKAAEFRGFEEYSIFAGALDRHVLIVEPGVQIVNTARPAGELQKAVRSEMATHLSAAAKGKGGLLR